MRILSLSLITVVVISIFGLGLLINTVYEHRQNDNTAFESSSYLEFGLDLAHTLDTLPNKESFVESWNKNNGSQASIFPIEDITLPDQLALSLSLGDPLVLESESGIEAYFLLEQAQEILVISFEQAQNTEQKRHLELLLTLSFYGGITTIILIWIWPLIHHLNGLRHAALRFGQGDLSVRTKAHRLSYICDIEREFNGMADRIESLIQDNKLLSRAVSHDLKTPLARLRFGLDALTETDNPALRDKYSSRVNRDMEEMESLIDTLLQYARLDESNVSMLTKDIPLVPFIEHLIAKLDPEHISINLHTNDPNCSLKADTRYLSMLFNNILSNAIRHAKSKIKINIQNESRFLRIAFEDDGEGIPEVDRVDVTKPFWRGSQSREKHGHGMGMAIVARIAEWHGAELEIDQSFQLGGAKIALNINKT